MIVDYDGGEYQTMYSHISIDARDCQHVEKGDMIGIINNEENSANCDCDNKNGKLSFFCHVKYFLLNVFSI